MLKQLSLRCAALLLLACSVHAAETNPTAGTLTATSSAPGPVLAYTAGPFQASNQNTTANAALQCQSGNAAAAAASPTRCDFYRLQVNIPGDYRATHGSDENLIRVSLKWPTTGANAPTDFDIHMVSGTAGAACTAPPEEHLGSSAQGTDATLAENSESFDVPLGSILNGNYVICIVPFNGTNGVSATGRVELIDAGAVEPPPPPPPPVAGSGARYRNYVSPSGMGDSSGEPSVGFNPLTKRAMYIAGTETLRITFPENLVTKDAANQPLPTACEAQWEDVTDLASSVETVDPIIFTEQTTGTTFVSHNFYGPNALFGVTTDDGETWTSASAGPPNGGTDHQTVAAGPYPADFPAADLPGNPGYAVYFCSHSQRESFCSRSDDGGQSFGPGVPWGAASPDSCTLLSTVTIHGHARVAYDGTVVVPLRFCNDQQAFVMSEDAGTTWQTVFVPETLQGEWDPQLAWSETPDPVTNQPVAFFCFINGYGEPMATVSKDKGGTWSPPVKVAPGLNIKHAAFPQAIAGDHDRAACAFIGTTTQGLPGSADFQGVWHAYVGTTYNQGNSWVAENITPNQLVQGRGGICSGGIDCGNNRNMLDFNEFALDTQGRPLFSYSDGCAGANCTDASPPTNAFTEKAVLARQSGGKTLFKAFDAQFPATSAPQAPCLSGSRDASKSALKWIAPDTGGTAIARYKLYRSTSLAGPYSPILTTTGPALAQDDLTALESEQRYFYRVSALNTMDAEGALSNVIELPLGVIAGSGNVCEIPGLPLVSDPSGDDNAQLPTADNGSGDILGVKVSEPDGSTKLIIQLQMRSLETLPPNLNWFIIFNTATAGYTQGKWHVDMGTDETGLESFSYGRYNATNQNLSEGPATGDGTSAQVMAGSSYDPETGVITFVVDKVLFGPDKTLIPGKVVNNVQAVIYQLVGVAGTGSLQTIDSSGTASYTLRGVNDCIPNLAPTASLAVDKVSGKSPLEVVFTLSGSDPDAGDSVRSYSLDFGDGTPALVDVAFDGSPVTVAHTYSGEGTVGARLTVKDSFGLASNPALKMIEVLGTVAPTAKLKLSPGDGLAALDVLLSDDGSSDGDADELVEFVYEVLDSSGASVARKAGTSAAESFTVRLPKPGRYNARLAVKDSTNKTGVSAPAAIDVFSNPPVPSLTADKLRIYQGRSVAFTGSATDADIGEGGDSIASYTLSFGEGSPVTQASGTFAPHVYNTAGNFTATLSAKDSYNTTSTESASQLITVVAPTAPIARLAATPVRGTRPLAVDFDASSSSDPDTGDADSGDSIVSYTFMFGDGSPAVTRTVSAFPTSAAQVSHTYENKGTYTAKVEVTDSFGLKSNLAEITINADPVNTAPIAMLDAASNSGTRTLSVAFDASDSVGASGTNPDDAGELPELYAYDFGDGATLEQRRSVLGDLAAMASHDYTKKGRYTAKLTVTDLAGAVSTNVAEEIIEVAGLAPTAALSATPETQFSGKPVRVDASGSADPDAEDLVYEFSFGDGSPVLRSNSPVQFHTYRDAQAYSLSVTVTDSELKTATASDTVTVTAPANAAQEMSENDGTRGGGSFGFALLPLAFFGLRRRKR